MCIVYTTFEELFPQKLPVRDYLCMSETRMYIKFVLIYIQCLQINSMMICCICSEQTLHKNMRKDHYVC